MREGWVISCIGEIAHAHLGKMLDKNKNRGAFKPYLRNLNVRWFDFDLSDVLEMRFEDDERERYTARKGDLLICEGGYPGRAAIWEDDEPIYFQKAIHRVRFYEPERAKWFLYYLYLCDIDGSLRNHFTGVGIQHFTGEALKRFRVPLPPVSEQQRIVAILDEAFAGLATTTANAEKNLNSARELFDSYLNSVFNQSKPLDFAHSSIARGVQQRSLEREVHRKSDPGSVTKTGGRAATTRHIAGKKSLCVGMPKLSAREGWGWRALDELARMETGHTPSRRHPEYWGGDVPWIGIRDAKSAHGREIFETLENTNELGLENSSARLLPSQTVCLSRTASVGYVTIMGRPMATSQDFVNWVCSDELYPQFLMYLFLAQGAEIFRFSSGAVHQTIYFPEAKAFHICLPSNAMQRKIVTMLDAIREQTERLEGVYHRKLANLAEAKQSILRKAFAGDLTSPPLQAVKEAAE
ncbi:MAG TPA: restriction endonuclease subunit S [Xanthobacteraceae bacterium]|nr:restriction endonuclease subunit S [Xanthobacteraceae bacterium]